MLKELIKDNTVKFEYYRKQHLYYSVVHPDGTQYLFPVPMSDIGDATFLASDKAGLFMRYISNAIKDGSLVKWTK